MGIANHAKRIKFAITFCFFLFIVLFAFFRSYDLIFGVKIKNVAIGGVEARSGEVYKESPVKITGNAKNAIKLTLNGREISIDLEGDFEETIALGKGYNELSIRAIDKFGYVDEKDYQLIFVE